MRTLRTAVLTLVTLLVSGLASAQTPAKPSTLDYTHNTLYPATVLLFQQQEDGTMRFSCTATAFDYNEKYGTYMFATAAHCIDSDDKHSSYVSLDESGSDKVFTRAEKPLCGDQEDGNDVCIVFVHTKTHFAVAEIGDDPVSGESIVSVESPAGLGKQVLHGYIALSKLDRIIRDEGLNWTGNVILQLPGVLGGSSGSAVVCESSLKICAITVGVYSSQQGQIQVAVPISRLKLLLANRDKYRRKKKSTKDSE